VAEKQREAVQATPFDECRDGRYENPLTMFRDADGRIGFTHSAVPSATAVA
jgi:hypothetical protein